MACNRLSQVSALEEFVTGRPLLEEQSRTQLLKRQRPSIFTMQSHYVVALQEFEIQSPGRVLLTCC
jgi:hypothetical protein